MREDLKAMVSLFGSLSRSLEVLWVLYDKKEGARIAVRNYNLSRAKTFAEGLGLHTAVSSTSFLFDTASGYSSKAMRINTEIPSSFKFLYVSKRKRKSERMREYDEEKNHKKLGKALGYPKCCIKFFIKNHEEEEKGINDFVMPAIMNSEGSNFPWQSNFFTRYFDLPVISHLPCSFRCRKTTRIAERNIDLAKSHFPHLYNAYLSTLKSGVIYSKGRVYLFQGIREFEDNFNYTKVIASHPDDFYLKLSARNTIPKRVIEENEMRMLIFE